MTELSGKSALVIVSQRGVEQDEIEQPVTQLDAEGASVTVAAPTRDPVQSQIRDWELGDQITPDVALADVVSAEYDLLVIPGGVLNADTLRTDENAQQIANDFVALKKPVASLCHGPWLLVETGAIAGKQATSYPSLKTDIVNAGGNWHDSELVRCGAKDWTLLTSLGPHDLPAFIQAMKDEVSEG